MTNIENASHEELMALIDKIDTLTDEEKAGIAANAKKKLAEYDKQLAELQMQEQELQKKKQDAEAKLSEIL